MSPASGTEPASRPPTGESASPTVATVRSAVSTSARGGGCQPNTPRAASTPGTASQKSPTTTGTIPRDRPTAAPRQALKNIPATTSTIMTNTTLVTPEGECTGGSMGRELAPGQ